MLRFDEKFFEEEERCGFTVSAMMKRAWAGEMTVLDEVIRICDQFNIPYYADYGTLLGAVRHQGFVPWDDDIDISLKRPDYMRLLSVLEDELPEGYVVNNCYTDEAHRQPHTSVTNAKKVPVGQETIKKFYGCPYVVGIDIYPLDYVPRDEALKQTWQLMYNAVYDFAQRFDEIDANHETEIFLPQIEQICNVKIAHDSHLRNTLWKLADTIAGMFHEQESDMLTYCPRVVIGFRDFMLRKEWYNDAQFMPFEQMKIRVPMGYDDVLTMLYGNYHEYVNGHSGHDYPFYKVQEEYLRSVGYNDIDM